MPVEDLRSAALEGRTWHLARGVDLPGGTTISARFAGGTVSGTAGANRYRAEYRLDGTSLSLGPPATTTTAGDASVTGAERDFLTLLEAVAGYRGNAAAATLSLLDGAGDEVLVFAAAPEIGADLTGRWDVRSFRVGDGLGSSAVGSHPHLAFDGSGQVTGSAGVNRLHGPARADGDRLHLGPLVTTRMAGEPRAMDDEAALLVALDEVAAHRISDDGLVLLDADGEMLVRLTRSTEVS